MAEHIDNNATLLSSGGHRWVWESVPVAEKVLGSVGLAGNWSLAMGSGGVNGVITGVLRGEGGNLAAARAALNALEAAIETLCRNGNEVAWEDDLGRSGTRLVLRGYQRQGPAEVLDGGLKLWQRYAMVVRENSGRITG